MSDFGKEKLSECLSKNCIKILLKSELQKPLLLKNERRNEISCLKNKKLLLILQALKIRVLILLNLKTVEEKLKKLEPKPVKLVFLKTEVWNLLSYLWTLQSKNLDPTSTILGLSATFFKTILELSVLNSFFLFNNKFYQQLDGLGMGLPLGPTFANIFMCHYEQVWLADCPIDFKPVFYKRYIDLSLIHI